MRSTHGYWSAPALATMLLLCSLSFSAEAEMYDGGNYVSESSSGNDLYGGGVFIEEPSFGEYLADLVVVRPLMLAAGAAGTAIWVGALPFTLIAGYPGEAGETLIVQPMKYTFVRPLGHMEDNAPTMWGENDYHDPTPSAPGN